MDEMTARDLGAMVQYQPDAVVSRTVLKTGTGSAVLYAFDRGQDLSEHAVPQQALLQVLDGVAEIHVDGTPHRVGAGEMIVVPANAPFAVAAAERFKMMLVLIGS